ncbi:hypothetical protein PV783_24685 [Chitinophaga sp. CC14]|uniref:hypothetical protein n=1 Tax=Chitinophaga sp. CC14 TaxID=3029199 RepID=UPI003B76E94A
MRNISATFNLDGLPTKVSLRKKPRQRRFLVIINKEISEYGISDETNEVEYLEGAVLNPYLYEKVCLLIWQYFPKCRAIVKLGHDDYEDYDDY